MPNVPIYEPGLHKPIPLGSRVRVPANFLGVERTGRVAGIASVHVVFTYIVILDEPVEDGYGKHEAVAIPGPYLEGLDGSNWRLVD